MTVCSKSVQGVVLFFLLVGIGGMICGSYGSFWYVATQKQISELKSYTGMWKYCNEHRQPNTESQPVCTKRDKIFQFSTDENFMFQIPIKRYDIVLVLLIAAGAIGVISVFTTLVMCCLYGGSAWSGVSSLVCILSLLSGASASAVGYADFKIRQEIPSTEKNLYTHGWSSILAWVGTGAFILAFVLSIVMRFVQPKKRLRESERTAYETDTGFRYTPNNRPEYNTMSNKGYDTSNRRSYDNNAYQMK